MVQLLHLGTEVVVTWGVAHEGEVLNPTAFTFGLTRLDDAAFETLKTLIHQQQADLQQRLASAEVITAPLTEGALPEPPEAEPVSVVPLEGGDTAG